MSEINLKILVISGCFQCYYFDSLHETCMKSGCGLYPESGFAVPDWCELDEAKEVK